MRHTITVSGTHMKIVVYESDTDRILDKTAPLVTTFNLRIEDDLGGEPTWVRIELPKRSMQDIERLFTALGAEFKTEFFKTNGCVAFSTQEVAP